MSTSLKKFTRLVWVIIRAPFSAWETDFLFKSREREKEEVRVGKNSFLSWFYDLCSSIEKKKRRFIFNLKCLFMNYIRCKLLYDMNEVSYKLEIFLLRGLVFFEATCIIKVNSNYVKNFKIVCLHTG